MPQSPGSETIKENAALEMFRIRGVWRTLAEAFWPVISIVYLILPTRRAAPDAASSSRSNFGMLRQFVVALGRWQKSKYDANHDEATSRK